MVDCCDDVDETTREAAPRENSCLEPPTQRGEGVCFLEVELKACRVPLVWVARGVVLSHQERIERRVNRTARHEARLIFVDEHQ